MSEPAGSSAAYGPELTAIHDAAFAMLAEAAATLLLSELGPPEEPGHLLDLGCGGGILSAAAANAGFAVSGVDISPDQIRLARERVPAGDFEIGSWTDHPLPRGLGAITAVGEVLNYGFDPVAGADAIEDLAGRAFEALMPGGLLIFDLAGPGRVEGGMTRNFTEGAGWAILYSAEESSSPPRVTRRIVTFTETDGAGWSRAEEVHILHLHGQDTVTDWLESAGFQVEVRDGYSANLTLPSLPVFLARRPA